MTLVLPGADIRGFYNQLGIPLADWAHDNAATRCFADPHAHQHGDRTPSTSVNLEHGAWKCHACGAQGGAYDAALAKGHTPRSAIDTMIAHRLIPPRHARPARPAPITRASSARPRLRVSEQDIRRWQAALRENPAAIESILARRAWSLDTMYALGLGIERGRITIPIRDGQGRLQGVLRYQPEPAGRRKMLAVPGTRLGLIPYPTRETCPAVMLVEGPPDMIAARSHGIPAIAVPSVRAWHSSWAPLLAGRHVVIVMDADEPGREAARRIAADLRSCATVQTLDIAADRDDGYDLTDWLLEHSDFDLIRSRRGSCYQVPLDAASIRAPHNGPVCGTPDTVRGVEDRI